MLIIILLLAIVVIVFTQFTDVVYATFHRMIEVVSGVELKVDGKKFSPTDANGKQVEVFVYQGTSYVPLRAIAELYGSDVDWNAFTNTIEIDSKGLAQDFVEAKNTSLQSDKLLAYTGQAWSKELERDLAAVDFSMYNFDSTNPKQISDSDINSTFVLVNKANFFGDDFVPINLVDPQSAYAGGGNRNRMRKVAADALDSLVFAAKQAGYDIQNVSAYRSIAYQRDLFQSYVNKDGIEAANKYSSKPGYSEHHTGLCTDVSSPSMNFGLGKEYGNTAEGKWLAANAHKFGFIIRYPKNKEAVVGYTYEPWHIRYLGVPLATYLYQTNLCFEEFLALQTGQDLSIIK